MSFLLRYVTLIIGALDGHYLATAAVTVWQQANDACPRKDITSFRNTILSRLFLASHRQGTWS